MKKITVFLFFFFVMTAVKAQRTEVSAAKTWKVISSLLSKTYAEAQSILKNNGLKMNEKEKNEEYGLDNYFFVSEKTKDPDMEPEYIVSCKDNKVVLVMVSYDYDMGEEETVLKKDREEIIKQLKMAAFTLAEEKKKPKQQVFKNKNNGACIYTDLEMASFSLMVGEVKYVEIITAD